MDSNNSIPSVAWMLLVMLSLIWGSSFLLIKLGTLTYTPLQVAAIRLTCAGLVLSPFLFRYLRQLTRKEFFLLVIIGITGNGLPAFLFPLAEKFVPTAVAGVLNAITPLFTIIIAFLFFQTRFPTIKVIGLLVGVVGTIVLMFSGGGQNEQGEAVSLATYIEYSLYAVLATVGYAISLNLTKTYFQEKPSLMITTVALVFLAIPSVIYLFTGSDFLDILLNDPKGWEAFGYIAALGAVGTAFAVVVFYRMLQMSNLIFATSVTYLIPVVAVLWGVFFLHESLNWQHFLGFVVILGGVYLVNRKK